VGRQSLIIIASCAALSAGCLEGTKGVGGPSTISRAVVCDYQIRCGQIGASEADACRASSGYAGLPFLDGGTLGRESDAYSTDEALRAERLGSDETSLACGRATLELASCSAPELLVCTAMFVGRVAPGGSCRDDRECTTRLCVTGEGDFGPYSGDPGCAGSCHVPLARGADCSARGALCANGDICDPEDQRCRARGSEGASCISSTLLSDCATGLFCNEEVRCESPRAEGAECPANTWASCESGLRCFEGRCAAPGKEGERCATSTGLGGLGGIGGLGGLAAQCDDGLYCDADAEDARCRSLVALGGACSARGQCLDDLPCVGLTATPAREGFSIAPGICAPWGDMGHDCDPDVDLDGCPFSMSCDTVLGVCVARARPAVALGERCDPSIDAANSSRCSEGSCDPETSRCALVCSAYE
jgi:hypothetical protein